MKRKMICHFNLDTFEPLKKLRHERKKRAFGCPGVVFHPLGLAFSKTASSVVSQTLLEHLKNKL